MKRQHHFHSTETKVKEKTIFPDEDRQKMLIFNGDGSSKAGGIRSYLITLAVGGKKRGHFRYIKIKHKQPENTGKTALFDASLHVE